jgi:23S rRNA (adenine2503-C2)-methyltransferase
MLDSTDLKKIITELSLPAYRALQLMQAVFREGKEDFAQMTTFPADLRLNLREKVKIMSLSLSRTVKSKDGSTEKALFMTADGCGIEAVLMRFKDGRNTVCVSSQAGCKLGCKFCATGKLGFKKDLDYQEIADQVLYFFLQLKKEDKRISNVVFMGMGEPFLNYDSVIRAIRLLNDRNAFDIGARNVTVSTAGIPEGIRRLAEEKIQVNLAVSLHSPDQEIRESIMPVAKLHSLQEVMDSIRDYVSKTNRRVSFEYVMLDGINDGPAQATALSKLLKNILCHVNLIPYNATGTEGIKGSARAKIDAFKLILEQAGIPVTVRVSLGQDIYAACGQLANKT